MISETIVANVITAIPVTITAIAGLVATLRNARKVEEVHKIVNSNMTALETKMTAATTRIMEMHTEINVANEHIKKLISIKVPDPSGSILNINGG